MARILTAGAPTAPTSRASANQADVLALVWGCLAELWLIGERYHRLEPAHARLDAQLNAAVLQEPEDRHPKYGEALQRFYRWQDELKRHDVALVDIGRNLAKHYGMLTEPNRATLIAGKGWSQEREPDRFAAEMLVMAMWHEPWPEGEMGFDLAPLRSWMAGQMQREREAQP